MPAKNFAASWRLALTLGGLFCLLSYLGTVILELQGYSVAVDATYLLFASYAFFIVELAWLPELTGFSLLTTSIITGASRSYIGSTGFIGTGLLVTQIIFAIGAVFWCWTASTARDGDADGMAREYQWSALERKPTSVTRQSRLSLISSRHTQT